MKVVVLERNSLGTDIDISCFERLGECVQYPVSLEADTPAKIKEADIIIVNKVPMNEHTLKDAKNLKLICVTATGVDNIDLDYTKSRGIKVTNVGNYSTAAVAQHTIALALYVLEKLSYYDNYVKSGVYGSQLRFSNFDLPFIELEGKTWGIIGLGNIGRSVAAIAGAFGCKVIFFSASGKNTSSEYERVEWDTFLQKSDIISIHCPLTERTRGIFDIAAFRKMKKSSILVNVARGPIVNERDLYTALTENMIAGAGLDVLEKEPIRPENPLAGIKDSTKLIITPHMAWASTEARIRLVEEVYKNAQSFLEGIDRNVL